MADRPRTRPSAIVLHDLLRSLPPPSTSTHIPTDFSPLTQSLYPLNTFPPAPSIPLFFDIAFSDRHHHHEDDDGDDNDNDNDNYDCLSTNA
jgi:hypothetical protein